MRLNVAPRVYSSPNLVKDTTTHNPYKSVENAQGFLAVSQE